jgi:hypothetical protein
MMRLTRWPRRSATQPVGTSSANTAEVTRGQHGGHQRRREAALVHEPDEVEAVHHALERGDVIRHVELKVTAEGSIGRHENSIAQTGCLP